MSFKPMVAIAKFIWKMQISLVLCKVGWTPCLLFLLDDLLRTLFNDIGLSENVFVTLLFGLLLKVPKVNLNILVRAVAPYVQALQ